MNKALVIFMIGMTSIVLLLAYDYALLYYRFEASIKYDLNQDREIINLQQKIIKLENSASDSSEWEESPAYQNSTAIYNRYTITPATMGIHVQLKRPFPPSRSELERKK